MPLNVQLVNAQVKDPDSGQMTPAGLIGSDAISTINTAKNQAVAAVQQKGVETLESIPDDYTALSNEVDGVKTQFNNYDDYIIGVSDLASNITYTDNYYLDDDGNSVSQTDFHYSDMIPVTGGKWIIYIQNGSATNPARVHGYTSAGVWDSMLTKVQIGPASGQSATMIKTIIFDVPDGVTGIKISTKSDKKIVAIKLYEPTINGKLDVNTNKIKEINNSLETGLNIFNKDDISLISAGYFRSNSTGLLVENSAFSEYLIPVNEITTYKCKGTSYYTSFYNENMELLGSTSDANGTVGLEVTTPKDCAYMSLNVRHATYPSSTYVVVQGTTLPDKYYNYGDSILKNNALTPNGKSISEIIDQTPEIYTVGTGKDYTTLTACLQALQGNENDKIIYIDSGTYDLYSEIGGDTFAATINNTDWRDWSLIVPPNTSIIGIGNVTFTFNVTSENTNAYSVLSALNFKGSMHLENITVIATNSRYAIHDDGSSTFSKTKHIYKNVRVTKNNGNGYMQACGFGIGADTTFEFDNCIINGRHGLTFHNAANGYNGIITIKNSVLIGREGAGLRISSMTQGDNTHTIICDCMGTYISQNIKMSMESTLTERTNPYILTVSKCGNVTIDTSAYTAEQLQFEPTIYQ